MIGMPETYEVDKTVPSTAERELAEEVAEHAMIAGWETACKKKANEMEVSIKHITDILDKCLAYNDKADASGRIHELEDWALERRTGSERARARP
jgi:hypothetical protein